MILFVWLLFAIAGMMILSPRNKGGTGFCLGLFLGPFGVLIAFIMRMNSAPPSAPQPTVVYPAPAYTAASEHTLGPGSVAVGMKRCTECAEVIQGAAKKCRYCGADVSAVPAFGMRVRCTECESIYPADRDLCPSCFASRDGESTPV